MRKPHNITKEQWSDREVMFTRELLCALIKQSVEDACNKERWKRDTQSAARLEAQEDAIRFIRSSVFSQLCLLLGLPADKIRKKAFL